MPTLNIDADLPLLRWPTNGLVAILDLEYTAWDGSAKRGWAEPWEWREIVQVGLLLVDGKNFFVKKGFETLVRPERNPHLSDYFKSLTGITQQQVETDALVFKEALTALRPIGLEADFIIFNGCDGQVLKENCSFHDFVIPWCETRMFNFRPLLANSLGMCQEELTSSDLPALAGVKVDGRPHSALHDCESIAAALRVWRCTGLI